MSMTVTTDTFWQNLYNSQNQESQECKTKGKGKDSNPLYSNTIVEYG